METEKWVPVGKAGRAVGLRGEVFVRMFNPASDLLSSVTRVRVGGEVFSVESSSRRSGETVLRVKEVADRESVRRLTGGEVSVLRSEFPELPAGEYYCCDLEGCSVENGGGEFLGTLKEVMPTASNDIYVVAGPGGETLIPVIPGVVLGIDIGRRKITVSPPEVADAV